MERADFDDRLFDSDSYSKEHWAEVPEPIRKIVEQHVAARLPKKFWRNFATCMPVDFR